MTPDIVVGALGVLSMLILLILGMEVYLALGLVGFLGVLWMLGFSASLGLLSTVPYSWASNFTLQTIPLFVLMGNFCHHAGISKALYDTCQKFLGHLPGGLAISTIGASAAMAACSGSSVANAASMGTIAIPAMNTYNYDPRLAAGAVAAGGTLGGMIPPSTGFIVIGAITGLSISKLFLAGLLPGILMMIIFSLTVIVTVRISPGLAPRSPRFSWKQRITSLREVWPIVILFLLVIGGMFIGYFTPTEAGAVGAFGALSIMTYRRRLSRKTLVASVVDTLNVTAMIFLIFIGAGIFGNFLTLTGLPAALVNWTTSISASPWAIIAGILLLYILLGMIMDMLAGMIITLPIVYPIVQALGFDMIWFCVLVMVLAELGLITPPVGLNVFVLKGVTGLSLENIFRGVSPFILSYVPILLILLAFPRISTWLPGVMMGR